MYRNILRIALLSAFLAVPPSPAHDFWLEPSSFTPTVGEPNTLRLLVGENLVGQPVGRPRNLPRFEASLGGVLTPVEGHVGSDPAGRFIAQDGGLAAIGYESTPSYVELEAARFEAYLYQEGLDRVVASRARRGETATPGRELFARSAKALLQVGQALDDRPSAPLELPLEFIESKNPAALGRGDTLELELRYRGAPVEGVLVVALPGRAPVRGRIATRTDRHGRVELPLDHSGAWLVKAVHMLRAPEAVDAQWISWWASLTFAIADG